MENCEYTEVENDSEKNIKPQTKLQWRPFLRQATNDYVQPKFVLYLCCFLTTTVTNKHTACFMLLICSGGWSSMFLYGLSMGSPTVIVPQLRKEANSTDAVTDEMASWLSSAVIFSAVPLIVVVAIVADLIGQKITFIAGAISLLVGYIIFYVSSNTTYLLIGLVIQGLYGAVEIATLNMILIEYTSPVYRGTFLLINIATMYYGIWAANAIGTFFHWKNISLLGIAMAMYVILTALMWPESPYWLASKEKFDKCEIAHRWLKGSSEESEKELEVLINSQKEYLTGTSMTNHNRIVHFWNTITSKEFYKGTLIAFATFCSAVFCGKFACIIYAIDIIKKITNNESAAYIGMLILDGVTVLSMYVGCILARYLKRRRLILGSTSISAVFLFILSLYLYIIKKELMSENKYVSIVLLAAFSIAAGCGPIIMGQSFFGEMLPIKSRYLSFCLTTVVIKTMGGSLLKFTPSMLKTLGPHGFFLFYGISLSIVVLILYKYLPETKGKTIQEITDSIEGKEKTRLK